jgi:hypothetical protein
LNASTVIRIDKSILRFGELPRHRNKTHLRFVAMQPCLVCGRAPSDPHHLRFAQPRALARKTRIIKPGTKSDGGSQIELTL